MIIESSRIMGSTEITLSVMGRRLNINLGVAQIDCDMVPAHDSQRAGRLSTSEFLGHGARIRNIPKNEIHTRISELLRDLDLMVKASEDTIDYLRWFILISGDRFFRRVCQSVSRRAVTDSVKTE